jgi:DNA-binding response OmpR family regulator
MRVFILDFDLGAIGWNGLDLIREYRKSGGIGHICLHTNRADSDISKSAIEAGANTVYPKPIDVKHLASLFKEVVAKRRGAFHIEKEARIRGPVEQPLRIALIEDSLVMRVSWRQWLGDSCVLSEFKFPEDFMSISDSTYDFIITDMNFDGSDFDGADIAKFAKQNKMTDFVFLSSGVEFEDKDGVFDCQLDKSRSYTLVELKSSVQRRRG